MLTLLDLVSGQFFPQEHNASRVGRPVRGSGWFWPWNTGSATLCAGRSILLCKCDGASEREGRCQCNCPQFHVRFTPGFGGNKSACSLTFHLYCRPAPDIKANCATAEGFKRVPLKPVGTSPCGW